MQPLDHPGVTGSYAAAIMVGAVIILGYVVLSDLRGRMLVHMANFGSLLLLLQVLFMRFNVVIGGQLISKSERGFVDFHFEVFTKEGVLTAAVLLAAPFVAYYVISRFIPIFEEPAAAAKADPIH